EPPPGGGDSQEGVRPPLREPQRACMRATAALRRLLASRSAPVARSDIFSASYELAHTARRVVAPYGHRCNGHHAESWPRPASLAAARQFAFSDPTKPVYGVYICHAAASHPLRESG